MTTVYYNKGKIALTLFGGIACTFAGLWLFGIGHGKLAFAGVLLALVGPPLMIGCTKRLLGDPVALRFDGRGVSGSTMWRKFDVSWSDVENIGIGTVTTSTTFGLFKTTTESLEIKTTGGPFGGKKYSFSPGLLALGSGGMPGLIEQLVRAKSGAPVMNTAPVAQREAPRDSLEGLRPEVFDADAAFARYMAKQAQTADARSVQPMPVEPPRPAYAPPARPVFGRKAA